MYQLSFTFKKLKIIPLGFNTTCLVLGLYLLKIKNS